MSPTLDAAALDLLFRDARTPNAWKPGAVGEETLRAVWDLMKWAPTSANCLPARIIFLASKEAKERIRPMLVKGNVEKVMGSAVTAIIGMDMEFYEYLPKLFPHSDAKSWFVGNDALIYETAFRNTSMQAAYFIMACRALGLDCGPMSGFDQEAVNKDFFAGTEVKASLICAIGKGDPASVFPRSPRFDFEDVCRVL